MHNSQLATTFVLLFWCILINLKIQSHVPFDLLSTQTSAISAYEKVTDEFSETDIDFSKYQIIAVFDVVHGNGGWSIDITGISEYKPTSEITVTIENLKKGNSASVITHPYHIVKIPRTANKIRFQEIDIPLWDYQLEGAGTSCQWINLGYKNELIVINSNEKLGNYISCDNGSPRIIGGLGSCRFMLLANGQTNYGISNISKKLQQLYQGKYVLNVEISLNDATAAEFWCFVVIVERGLEENDTIELNVTTIKDSPL